MIVLAAVLILGIEDFFQTVSINCALDLYYIDFIF